MSQIPLHNGIHFVDFLRQLGQEVVAEDARDALQDAGVDAAAVVDAVDVGTVAAELARQPDAGAVLFTEYLAYSLPDMHGAASSGRRSPDAVPIPI